MRVLRRYDSARAGCAAPRASLGRLRSMIHASVAPASNRSPHSSSPAISDTARAPALQVEYPVRPLITRGVLLGDGRARTSPRTRAMSEDLKYLYWEVTGYGSQRL